MPTCCVVSCRSKRKLHRFPRDPEIRNQWILATRQPAGWAPRADDRICSYHFLPSAITPTGRVRNPSIPVIAGKSFLDYSRGVGSRFAWIRNGDPDPGPHYENAVKKNCSLYVLRCGSASPWSPDQDPSCHLWCGSGCYQSCANLRPLFYRPCRLHFEPPQLLNYWILCGSGPGSCFWRWCGSGSSFSLWCWSGSGISNDAAPDPQHWLMFRFRSRLMYFITLTVPT